MASITDTAPTTTTNGETMTYAEIDRTAVPTGSFRYGQLASVKVFDVPSDCWAVCTDCQKPKNEADNGASGFDTVLVAHFLFRNKTAARECALSLADRGSVGPVTLVGPEAS